MGYNVLLLFSILLSIAGLFIPVRIYFFSDNINYVKITYVLRSNKFK